MRRFQGLQLKLARWNAYKGLQLKLARWNAYKGLRCGDYALTLLRMALGGLFIIASAGKLYEPTAFFEAVDSYQILPTLLVPAFAIVLPWIEFLCGVLLIVGFAVESAALLVSMLLSAFITGITVNLLRGVPMSCGCFGFLEGGEEISWFTVLRNVALLIVALMLILYNRRTFGLEYWLMRRRECMSTQKQT